MFNWPLQLHPNIPLPASSRPEMTAQDYTRNLCSLLVLTKLNSARVATANY